MPMLYRTRPLNTKIVYYHERTGIYDVYNTTNAVKRQFTSIQRMFSYHSDRTEFIDYASSQLIDKENSIRQGRIVTSPFVIIYRESQYYRTINYQRVTTPSSECRLLNLSYFSGGRILQIQNSITTTVQARGINVDDLLDNMAINVLETTETINEHLIYNYHGGPREVHFKRVNDEPETNKYFGIELEVDMEKAPSSSRTHRRRNVLASRLHALLNEDNYNSLVKFETDASIGSYGVEIITQPMTMNYILTNKEKFKEAMRIIDELQYSSHDSGKCGMHIHVSRNYLSDETLDNIFLIFENFKNEIIAFSRRNQNQMRWCRFMTDDNSREIINEQYIKEEKMRRTSHGCAINNGNRNTVEFRIFRGTTKLRTFLANIQLIDNIIEIAKNKRDVNGITWNMIINHNDEYTELKEYNEKRGIMSKHELSTTINRIEVTQRPVILTRPFQITLEGDN